MIWLILCAVALAISAVWWRLRCWNQQYAYEGLRVLDEHPERRMRFGNVEAMRQLYVIVAWQRTLSSLLALAIFFGYIVLADRMTGEMQMWLLPLILLPATAAWALTTACVNDRKRVVRARYYSEVMRNTRSLS